MIQKYTLKERYFKRGLINRWFKTSHNKMMQIDRRDRNIYFANGTFTTNSLPLINILDAHPDCYHENSNTIVPVITREEVVTWLHELSRQVHESKCIIPAGHSLPTPDSPDLTGEGIGSKLQEPARNGSPDHKQPSSQA